MSNSRIVWLNPDEPKDTFPPVESALSEPNGLLAAGGDLTPERLLHAYRRGIFPWYEEGQPPLWWSPDPRCVLEPGDFHLSRRQHREWRHSAAEVRFNTSFCDVIRACAAPRRTEQGTWITADILTAFKQLHDDGWAHSLEIWNAGSLVGGLYGLAIGRTFFAESMYSAIPNASKLAVMTLSRMMEISAFDIVDCQVESSHLLSLGASLISRSEFVARLAEIGEPASRFGDWPTTPLTARELVSA